MEAGVPRPQGQRPIDVGRVIAETFSIYRANAAPLLTVSFAIFVLVGVLFALADTLLLLFLSTLVLLIAGAVYTGFVVKLVEDVRDGRRDFTARELFSSAWPYAGLLVVNAVIRAIGVLIGLVLFIVPGLYLLTIWAVTSPAIVVEDEDALSAFGRSNALTEGQRMAVFLTILTVLVITQLVPPLIVGIVAAGSVGLAVIVSIVLTVVVPPIGAIVSAVLFFDLGGGSAPAEDTQVIVEY